MTKFRARFIELMTPNKRDVEIIKAIETGGNSLLGQPRNGSVPTNQSFEQLESVECDSVIIENYSEVTLQVKRGSTATTYYNIPPDTGREIDVQENANELFIRNGTDSTAADFIYHIVNEDVN